jgi:amino acid permease
VLYSLYIYQTDAYQTDAEVLIMQNFPLIKWANTHPRLAAWILLASGMVILLVINARDVGLLATQWLALVIATVLVAGLCVWIISWEDTNAEDLRTTSEIEAVKAPTNSSTDTSS